MFSKYVLAVEATDGGRPTRRASAAVRIDTFDPAAVVVVFNLSLTPAAFADRADVFLRQLCRLLEAAYPGAVCRLWRVVGRAVDVGVPVGRRRLLQAMWAGGLPYGTVADTDAANIFLGGGIFLKKYFNFYFFSKNDFFKINDFLKNDFFKNDFFKNDFFKMIFIISNSNLP